MLDIGAKVKLNTFNRSSIPPKDCGPSENYWLLIGETGTIVKSENSRFRVLVQFDNSVESKGLHCHNQVSNSLLILTSDLELIKCVI